jgi:orotidine-5'-phosphate decarboxylase
LTRSELIAQIRLKKSFLCIGLDTDIEKIPSHLIQYEDPVFEFNKDIINATKDLCVAYKINTAFYESRGVQGWESMKRTLDYIPADIFTIADAKRGDIGNTSAMYARAFFDKSSSGFEFDGLTVNPYMGEDSVTPFLQYENKWVILLALTSNKGSEDFQHRKEDGKSLYVDVIRTSKAWGNAGNLMYVIGATHPDLIREIRNFIPDHFLLIPGIGSQGGDLKKVVENGMNKDCGLLVNISRNIIYAGKGEGFTDDARAAAMEYQSEMVNYLQAII